MVQHRGGSIVLWGCFSSSITGQMVRYGLMMNGGKTRTVESVTGCWGVNMTTTQNMQPEIRWDGLDHSISIFLEWPSQSTNLN